MATKKNINQCSPKITMISSLPPIIGLSPYTKGLVEALKEYVPIYFLGFRNIYPAFLYPGQLKDPSSVPLEESGTLTIRNVLDWFNPFGWIIEAFRINSKIVHGQWWSYPLAPVYFTILGISRLRKKKIVLTVHNVKPHERSLVKNFLNRCIFNLADELIVHTENNKKELKEMVKNQPIHVIPHGLILHPLKGIDKNTARKLLNISAEDKILLCFGHIRDYKGLDVALKTLSHIKDKNVKLFIAGHCWEDWRKYADLINELYIRDRVILKIGFIPTEDIEPIFMASDIILLPYKHFNAQSGVGALVLPYEKPMIVSDTGGLTDYVSHETCIVPSGDDRALAESIMNILNNASLRDHVIANCRKLKSTLSWNTIAKKTEQVVYHHLLN